MLTPSNVTAAQFNSAIKGGEPSHVRFTFTGQNIMLMDDDISQSGGVILHNYLNADTDLTIGVAVRKELTAYIINSNAISSLDREGEFKFEVGTEVNGSIEWVTQGYFTGIRPARIYNVDVIQFVAYDRMNKFDILADDWLGNLTYPMTIRQMYDSLCLYCGVHNEVGDELANIMSRSYASAPIKNTGLSCRDILTLIAEAAGCYAKITAGGKVKLVWYNSTSYSITGDDEFSIENVDLQSINLMAIDGLNVKQTETDTGVLIQTGSRNTYLIVDNPFLVTSNSTEEDDYIQPIFDRLSGFGGYLPMNVVCIGNPLIEAGDIISVAIGNDTFSLPIFNKEESFNGALTDMYEATGNMQRQTYTQALKQKLSQGGRYHIFRNDIDELYSELYDPTTGDVSILKQTAQDLGLSANGIDIVGGKYVKIISGGTFLVDATNFKIDSANKYMKCGNWEFSDDGTKYTFQSNNDFRIYTGKSPADGGTYPANIKCGIRVYKPQNTWNEMGIVLVNPIDSSLYEFTFAPRGAVSGTPGGVDFNAPDNANPMTGGWYRIYSRELQITQDGYYAGISYQGTKAKTYPIRFVDNTVDIYGNGIVIGDGGLVVVGAGESSSEVINNAGVSGGTETLYLASDTNIKLLTNVNNGYSSRKEFTAGADGSFVAPGRLYQNGNQAVPLTDTNTWRGYQIKNYDVEYTGGANTYKDITANNFGASTPSGYTPVAITMFNPGNDKCWVAAMKADATGTTPMMTVHNPTNGSFTNHAYIAVLYLQTGSP